MHRKIILALAAVFITAAAAGQNTLEGVLRSVEANNLTLRAQAEAVRAQKYEARMGNSPGDLSVGYDYNWNSPSSAGNSQEVSVVQAFELPNVYVARGRLAGNLGLQYENQYARQRQQILLQAKQIYIELNVLRKLESILSARQKANAELVGLYREKFDRHDATILDKNKIEYESFMLHDMLVENRSRAASLRMQLVALNGGEEMELDFTEDYLEALGAYDAVLADYLDLSLELELSRLREEGAALDVRASRSGFLPKLEVGYKYETSPDQCTNGLKTGISIPLFSNRRNVQRARAAHKAAQLESQAALTEIRTSLAEMYAKADILSSSLGRYDEMADTENYLALLGKSLAAQRITLLEYFAECNAYYDMMELKYRLECDYKLLVAQINMIYL